MWEKVTGIVDQLEGGRRMDPNHPKDPNHTKDPNHPRDP